LNGFDGCCLHINATDHTTGECRVLLAQAKRMRAVWEAQPREQHSAKRQKTYNNNNNNNKNKGAYQQKHNGDFHTLLNQVERVKDSLKRAIQQQETTSGKRKNVISTTSKTTKNFLMCETQIISSANLISCQLAMMTIE
jgi:hypothetical protein